MPKPVKNAIKKLIELHPRNAKVIKAATARLRAIDPPDPILEGNARTIANAGLFRRAAWPADAAFALLRKWNARSVAPYSDAELLLRVAAVYGDYKLIAGTASNPLVISDDPLPDPSPDVLDAWDGDRYAATFFGSGWRLNDVACAEIEWPEDHDPHHAIGGHIVTEVVNPADLELLRRLWNDRRRALLAGYAVHRQIAIVPDHDNVDDAVGAYYIGFASSRLSLRVYTYGQFDTAKYHTEVDRFAYLPPGVIDHVELHYRPAGCEPVDQPVRHRDRDKAVAPIYFDALCRFVLPFVAGKKRKAIS